MPKKPVQRSSTNPYHLIARSNNKEWFYIPIQDAWRIMGDSLYATSVAYSLRIHAFVLMSNHFHMVASTPEKNIDAAMNYFMREVSRTINNIANRTNHVFGGPYKGSLIGSERHYLNVMKYVYTNPVRANICDRPEYYPYSSLAGKIGLVPLNFPVAPFMKNCGAIPTDPLEFCNLICRSNLNKRDTELIRLGLRRSAFELPRYKAQRCKSDLA